MLLARTRISTSDAGALKPTHKLIGARDESDVDLGIDLEPQPEDEEGPEVFKDLRLERSERADKPLFEGTWK
jgi:hypothetical protein